MPGRKPQGLATRGASAWARRAHGPMRPVEPRVANLARGGAGTGARPDAAQLRARLRRLQRTVRRLRLQRALERTLSARRSLAPRHVNIGLPFGTSLSDPHRRLLGTGSRVRHLTVRERSALRDSALARFAREAVGQALASATTLPPLRRRLVMKAIYARQLAGCHRGEALHGRKALRREQPPSAAASRSGRRRGARCCNTRRR
jgi:hypothetical protein